MESGCGSTDGGRRWRAEEVVAGNDEALQALRELVIYPIRYSREAQKLGLKVIH